MIHASIIPEIRCVRKVFSCKKTTSTTTLVGRCGSCGNCDPNNLGNQANFKGCKYYNYIKDTYGYTDDALEYYVFTKSDLSLAMADLCSKWFGKATAYQKMKWAVSEKIKDPVFHIFTNDITIWNTS